MNYKCPLCQKDTNFIGFQKGKLDARDFLIRRCNFCHYSFVENFRTDFDCIYNESYYRGDGADPSVNFLHEVNNPSETIRTYEWQGIYDIYIKLFPSGGKWLDFGCGLGGLVGYANQKGVDIVGFEEGWSVNCAHSKGLKILTRAELNTYAGQFDFITAIEVLEHLSDPVVTLKKIRELMKPGGVLFITTGNAAPWRSRLLNWSYTQCPDVHISFFEPETLAMCLKLSGFEPNYFASPAYFIGLIKFKVLKALKMRRKNIFLELLPWSFIARVVDARYRVSKQPYGVANEP